MLDIHVIHCAEPEPWLLRCLQSLGTLPYRVIPGAGRSTAELAVWIGLAVAGFALAGLLLLRPRRPAA